MAELLQVSDTVLQARRKWRYTGVARPAFAASPAQGQISVWDFPRPPRIESVDKTLLVRADGQEIACTNEGVRVLETAGAPTYYFPPDAVCADALSYGDEASLCEWKGEAQVIHVGAVENAGWRYLRMFPEFADLYLWPSFYPGMLECFVDGEPAAAQAGGYYGGWVTRDLCGPIKGEPGSANW